MCVLEHIGATFKVKWLLEKILCTFIELEKDLYEGKFCKKPIKCREKMQNFTSPTKSMHKIFSRGQKLCAFYQKCGAFWEEKNCAPFCALFGLKRCAFEFKIIKNSGNIAGSGRRSRMYGLIKN